MLNRRLEWSRLTWSIPQCSKVLETALPATERAEEFIIREVCVHRATVAAFYRVFAAARVTATYVADNL